MPRKHWTEKDRLSNDEYFMRLAHLIKMRSSCIRNQVGAVLVKNKRIIATGYNGAPKGIEHCFTRGCLREQLKVPSGERHELCIGVHAEQNAVIQSAVFGVSVSGTIIYSTHFPCVVCARMLINAEISEIVYDQGYPDDLSMQLLKESGIKLRRYRAKK
jgi:dCMP deaminase